MHAARVGIILGWVVGCTPAGADSIDGQLTVNEAAQAVGSRVEVARVERTRSELVLSLPGEITGSRDALLASPGGGYVEAIVRREGAVVKKGQAIARINTSLMVAQQDQTEAQLAQAQAELERVQAMGDLSSAAELLASETQVAVLEAGLRSARIQTARSVISAPFAGVVSQLAVEEGEVAAPGAPVARLVSLDPVHVTVSVSDRDVGALEVGMPAQISVDALGQPFTGEVVRIDPAADPRTRTFMAEISVSNPEGVLLPGMIAGARLSAEAATDAIVLPQDWLVTARSGVGVFIVEEGHAAWRPVETGAVVHDQIVVLDGIGEGDQVVMVGHRNLVDGDSVLIAREGVCCTHGRATF